jgi:hypothetical protein
LIRNRPETDEKRRAAEPSALVAERLDGEIYAASAMARGRRREGAAGSAERQGAWPAVRR